MICPVTVAALGLKILMIGLIIIIPCRKQSSSFVFNKSTQNGST
jgi:hypothetical protein